MLSRLTFTEINYMPPGYGLTPLNINYKSCFSLTKFTRQYKKWEKQEYTQGTYLNEQIYY